LAFSHGGTPSECVVDGFSVKSRNSLWLFFGGDISLECFVLLFPVQSESF
jgi:hypothetical protein